MTNTDISPEAVERLADSHSRTIGLGTAATLRALSAECERLKGINRKLCYDFNLMNQHGAKQDVELAKAIAWATEQHTTADRYAAALTQSRAETAAAYERAAQVYIDGDWPWHSAADDAIRALATPDQSSDLAAIEAAAEARGLRKAAEIVKARAALYAKKRDDEECEIDMHMTLIHTVEAHEYAVDAILAAIPQGDTTND